jgi:peroxiredoxin
MPAEELVGHEATDFRLPTADSREIALSDCLSQGPAVVWFSRGLGCPVCRRHRAQFTLGYPALRDLKAEILEVTPTPVDRAAFYFSSYALAFPYLCDPRRETATAYGMEQQPLTSWGMAKMMLSDPLGAPQLMREAAQGPNPTPEEKAGWSAQEGFFLIDQTGTIRVARVGAPLGMPSKAEVERMIREVSG